MNRTIDSKYNDLNEIAIFARVARAGSFTGAARELGMPKSTVSRKVTELEERLGVRLLRRTTRKQSLTDVGRVYAEYCARIIAEVDEARLAVSRLEGSPRGLLRVTAPLNFGFLGAIVTDFLDRYREVTLELVCTDRVINLVEEGFDVALRAGKLSDSSLIARNLGNLVSYLVASPAYLERRGRPKSPEDLSRHDGILFGAGADRNSWRLQGRAGNVTVSASARLIVNDLDILEAATLAGLGVALIPEFRCAPELRKRQLERLLSDYCSTDVPLHAVYPSTRHISPRVKVFLDHLQQHMSPPPWELRGRPR